jgi:hypothetical protein
MMSLQSLAPAGAYSGPGNSAPAPLQRRHTLEPIPRLTTNVRDGKHHHEFLKHEVRQGEREVLHEEAPHSQGSRSPIGPQRACARALSHNLETSAELCEKLGSEANTLALVPIDSSIHLSVCLGVEFETELHRP